MNLTKKTFLAKASSFKQQSLLVLILALCAVLSGCIKSNASEHGFARPPSSEVSETTLKLVDRTFYPSFIGGDWRYKGAKHLNGRINVYIQIPQDLDMSVSAQKDYLQQAICPTPRNHRMWQQIGSVPLSVHIYTDSKNHSVYAQCTNPLV